MDYKLSVEDSTYPVQSIETPTEFFLTHKPGSEHISFITPVRLSAGQVCKLSNGSIHYHLLIKSCLGFAFAPHFYASGIITTEKDAVDANLQVPVHNSQPESDYSS